MKRQGTKNDYLEMSSCIEMLPQFFYCGDYCLLSGIFLLLCYCPLKVLHTSCIQCRKVFKAHLSDGFKLLNFLIPWLAKRLCKTPYVSAELTEFALSLNLRLSCDLPVCIKINNIPLVFNTKSYLFLTFCKIHELTLNFLKLKQHVNKWE